MSPILKWNEYTSSHRMSADIIFVLLLISITESNPFGIVSYSFILFLCTHDVNLHFPLSFSLSLSLSLSFSFSLYLCPFLSFSPSLPSSTHSLSNYPVLSWFQVIRYNSRTNVRSTIQLQLLAYFRARQWKQNFIIALATIGHNYKNTLYRRYYSTH